MKQFITLVNNSIPFGKSLNAIAHTAIGIGHWLPDDTMPDITVLFADSATLYDFRQEVYKTVSEHSTEAVLSEFTHTMTGGSTEEQLQFTRETPENQLIYYAVSICANENLLHTEVFKQIFNRCQTLVDYEAYNPDHAQDADFITRTELPDYPSLPEQKIVLILDRNFSPAELVNAAVLACLSVGKKATLNQLKLLLYVDASDEIHPYISYHPLPILAAKKQGKFNELATQIEHDPALVAQIIRNKEGNVLALCMLGSEQEVNAYTYQKKFISFWNQELPADAFSKV